MYWIDYTVMLMKRLKLVIDEKTETSYRCNNKY